MNSFKPDEKKCKKKTKEQGEDRGGQRMTFYF